MRLRAQRSRFLNDDRLVRIAISCVSIIRFVYLLPHVCIICFIATACDCLGLSVFVLCDLFYLSLLYLHNGKLYTVLSSVYDY